MGDHRAYDEMVAGNGQLRPHWHGLLGTLSGLPDGGLAERALRARAQVAETDEILTLFGHNQPGGWTLDPVPLILPEGEWVQLSRGLAQRARLLDRILADVYGPQTLIAERLLPPYLVYGNPHFLRPCRRNGAPAAPGPHMPFYAADLMRAPDGSWRVIADRTQAPAGVGYALRNRRVLARTLPEAFRATPVKRLGAFTDLFLASLQALAPWGAPTPRVVVLTPGPYNPAYFEHVYLARELGLTLVQGADLTVRDDVVFLKTLDGLRRVDVVYRRVDGAYCDPLELRDDSALGITGLLQAQRAGNVAIVNDPGAALVETPALLPFLPGLAERLLGEELMLPAVTAWWCGQHSAREAIAPHPDDHVLVPTFASTLPANDPAALAAALKSRPEEVVALARLDPGVVPTVEGNKLQPKPYVLRMVLVWHDGDWVAMPGGVARVVDEAALYAAHGSGMQHGGVAKDVWVLTREERDVFIPAAATVGMAIQRGVAGELPSRVADDLFWFGRYAERIDAGARLFRAALTRLAGGGVGPRDAAELAMLAKALVAGGWVAGSALGGPPDGALFAQSLTHGASNGRVMRDCLDALRRLAFAIRDRLSVDMWHNLNHLMADVRRTLAVAGRDIDRVLGALDELIRAIAALSGMAADNMTRGAGWRFLEVGRRIERAHATTRTLSAVLRLPARQYEIGLRLALELCDSTITYRTRYPSAPRPAPAIDLILADPMNPRSLIFQLDQLRDHIDKLTATSGGQRLAEQTLARKLVAEIEVFDILSLEPSGTAPDLGPLFALLDRIGQDILSMSDLITRSFFSHVALPHAVGVAPRRVLAASAE